MFRCALTKRSLPDEGGIYIFVKRRFAFFLKALYVGKAANLRSRLVGHEKWGRAFWDFGATERHVLRISSESERRIVEEDLIRGLRPRLNDVQVPRGAGDAPNASRLRRKWVWRHKLHEWLTGSKHTHSH